MLIGENWKVESDEMGVTLFQKRFKGEKAVNVGEEYWCTEGYYPNCKAALRGLLNAEVMGTDLKDFETVVNKIEEVKQIIEKVVL